MNAEQIYSLKKHISTNEIFTCKGEDSQGKHYKFSDAFINAFELYFTQEGSCLNKSDIENMNIFIAYADGENDSEVMAELDKYLGEL